MLEPIYLSGKCHYASVVEPNTTFEPTWQIDIALDEESKKIVEEAGLNIKNKEDDRGEYVTLKRKVLRKDGSRRQAPSVKDSQNNPWAVEDEDGKLNYKLIGNGSTVNVKALPFDWNYAGKTGRSADLTAVQVVALIEYGNDFDVVDGGYINTEAANDLAFAN